MIKDKFGPKGLSFEAEFRKRVMNAKLEAFYNGQSGNSNYKLINLESLDPDPKRVIDVSQKNFFSALEPERIPRKFTYAVVETGENGEILNAWRTIIYMEEKVERAVQLSDDTTEFRRPDFFSQKYTMSTEEIAMLRENAGASFPDIIKKFRSRNLKILSDYIEIKSIDGNTPLDISKALQHTVKHLETFGSSLKKMFGEFHLDLSEKGKMNVILKEFYHPSLVKAEESVAKSFSYILKEQHTAVFTLVPDKGELEVSGKIAVEMISGVGGIDRILRSSRNRINPAELVQNNKLTGYLKRSVNFLNEIEINLPKILKYIK